MKLEQILWSRLCSNIMEEIMLKYHGGDYAVFNTIILPLFNLNFVYKYTCML